MNRYYLSKNYPDTTGAGNKAKTDMEHILAALGYRSAGLKHSAYPDKARSFIRTFYGVLRMFFTIAAGDCVVLQYPFKKYYAFACRIIHFRKGKVITVVHDLGAFRRKRLSVEKEIRRLHHTDGLVAHNDSMKRFLLDRGFARPVVGLGIFDYLSPCLPHDADPGAAIRVIYAGALKARKNSFLYLLDGKISSWQLELYGNGFEANKVKDKTHITYHGFCPSDQLIETVSAHYGLIWDGESASTCSGDYGEYLKINNPHKASLYIRCHLPLIIWKEAALAPFVREHKIGLCIGGIEELDAVLPAVSADEYRAMKQNIRTVSARLSAGFYISQALAHPSLAPFTTGRPCQTPAVRPPSPAHK
jgi:hypothetical protein